MGMGKMDLSKFDKKLPKRERISKAVMEQPADSEIAQYLAERARVEAICPNVPVCIVLDGSAIIKTGTIIEDILSAFRYAPKESSQIVIPLQVVEDIADTDACNRIANHQRHVSLERADLSLLPKECQAANSINMTLAVAAKNAAMKKLCLLISENAAMRIVAGTLGIKAMGTDEVAYKLSSFKQYWTNRRNITLGKITDNLDWGTILPLSLYSKMNREEYENYGYLMIEDGEEVVKEDYKFEVSAQRPQNHPTQESNTPAIEDWVRTNFHPSSRWDWFGLIYILYHSGQIDYEFNAERIKRDLNAKYPEYILKVPGKLNASKPMIYVKLVVNGTMVDGASELWTNEANNIKDSNFGNAAAKASFLTIKQLLPQYLKDFGGSVAWK